MTDLRHKERAKMRKYHCELWITKPDEFLIEADSIKEAIEEFAKIGYLAIFVCAIAQQFCGYSENILIVPCIFFTMAIIAKFMNR